MLRGEKVTTSFSKTHELEKYGWLKAAKLLEQDIRVVGKGDFFAKWGDSGKG